jgi:hypothetical protein
MSNALIAVAIVAVCLAVLGVRSALHSDMRAAHAEITTGSISGPAISVNEIQTNAKNLPVQDVKDPF